MSFQMIPISKITASKTNPRKIFEDEKLAELAESIRSKGVLQPILVRLIKDGRYELVAGERRFRAAQIADLAQIPAIVKKLTDLEVLEIQVIENDQREDVRPSERAQGYQQLIAAGQTTAQIGEKVGKSESWVRGVLRLGSLPEEALEAVDQGVISRSTAELIARVPGDEAKKKVSLCVLRGAVSPEHIPAKALDPLSFRCTKQLIQDHFSRELKTAPFQTKDATLPPGACTSCPKRAGNAGEDYSDVRADICMDPSCFVEKARLNAERQIKSAEEDGFILIDKKEAKELFLYGDRWYSNGTYLHLDGMLPYDITNRINLDDKSANKKLRLLLGKRLAEMTRYLVFSPEAKQRFELVKAVDAKKVLQALYPNEAKESKNAEPQAPHPRDVYNRACKSLADKAATEIDLLIDGSKEQEAMTLVSRLLAHCLVREGYWGMLAPASTPTAVLNFFPNKKYASPTGWANSAIDGVSYLQLMPILAAWAAWKISFDHGAPDEVSTLESIGDIEGLIKQAESEMIEEMKTPKSKKKVGAK